MEICLNIRFIPNLEKQKTKKLKFKFKFEFNIPFCWNSFFDNARIITYLVGKD